MLQIKKIKCNGWIWFAWWLAIMWWYREGQCVSDRMGKGWMDSSHPPLCDQGSQLQTSRVGRGAMNGGLCSIRGHHIPLEPLCGIQQSGGEGRPGQERTDEGRPGEETLSSLSVCHIKTLRSVPFM